ncbi:MAG TPA: ChbG/HpnK family deacetylase, partial [Tepidisphaeraceae bacterium]|nr:ChbG/HpnK family deacetylase [Tepidisphaeraceae bacterium]
ARFGARRIRIIRDELRLALRYDRRCLASKIAAGATFAALRRRCQRRLHSTRIEPPRRTYGLYQSGNMDEAYVLGVLEQVGPGDELYFHPNEGGRLDRLGPNEQDLQTLLSPAVARAVEAARCRFGGAAASPTGRLLQVQA